MKDLINRRDLLKLGGMGVAVFVSGTTLAAGRGRRKENESFYFVQLSDTHWGFNGPNINPDSQGTLKKAVAAVVRHASGGTNPIPASHENLIAGAKVYREMCSRCHGGSRESDTTYGRSFYPPAPQFPLTRTSYSDSEMFWIVKHGIRNTAMPAWGNLLSDEEIWQVVPLIRTFDSIPDS